MTAGATGFNSTALKRIPDARIRMKSGDMKRNKTKWRGANGNRLWRTLAEAT
jgi:hypothetical protein